MQISRISSGGARQKLYPMKPFRFILEPYKGPASRYTCPSCGKPKEFSRYIDSQTGDQLPERFGMCNRSDRCGYHLKPSFEDYSSFGNGHIDRNRQDYWKFEPVINHQIKPELPSFVPLEHLKRSTGSYQKNHFAQYLGTLLGSEMASWVIEEYNLGTSKHWPGANVFWQVDTSGNIRTGKIMLYNPVTGKRIKGEGYRPYWVHKALELPDFGLEQCFYGAHLLKKYQFKPVAIVESEKTAMIASTYFPQFVWLATGGKGNLSPDRIQILKGRKVVLFPDLQAYNHWKELALNIRMKFPGMNIVVSDYLESNANETEQEQGLDLADFLVRYHWKAFRSSDEVVLDTSEIACIPSVTVVDDMHLVCVRTSEGKYYDLLFNQHGEPVRPGETLPIMLKTVFKRVYKPGTWDGRPCLICIPDGSK